MQAARAILDALKTSAEVEEASGFDPSGSGNSKDVAVGYDGAHDGAQLHSDEVFTGTSTTDLTGHFSAFMLDDGSDGYDKGIDALSLDEKTALLKEMFASLKPYDVEFALKKQKGNFGAAFDDLLTQKFLAEEGGEDEAGCQSPRGVDGFAADEGLRRGKKGKGKKKQALAKISLNERMVDGAASSLNRWQMAKDEVKFIASRTSLSESTINSIYNASGHSLRATIIAICKKDPRKDLGCQTEWDDALLQSNIVDLRSEFPSVALSYLQSLALLTHPLMVSARELAEIITDYYQERLVPQYVSTKVETHPDYNEAEDLPYHSSISSLPMNTQFDTLRSTAFAQASAAYRKSRSNPLMGGAAAHYAEIGHTANAAMKRSRAIEANSRVAAQSSPDMCDLHGVTVADANRIAKQYVERWWAQRSEWTREGSTIGGSAFRIVVGRGAHSSTGVSKLGPAVSKMLRGEGWRVDEQVGEILVRGRVRK